MNTKGKSHEIEPDDLDDFECAVWFEDMPDDEQEARTFHNKALDNIGNTCDIFVQDLRTDTSDCPDYHELERRVHDKGLDTYHSDTRLIVFSPRPEKE
jgi:hypothetical protein